MFSTTSVTELGKRVVHHALFPWLLPLLVAAFFAAKLMPGHAADVSSELVKEVDLARASAVVYEQTQNALLGAVQEATARADSLKRAATDANVKADGTYAQSQALGRRAKALADSARDFEAAYALQSAQVASLEWVVSQKDTVIADLHDSLEQQKRATAAQSSRADSADNRARRLQDLNERLGRETVKVARGCVIVMRIPCPTRTQTYVGGVLTGGLAILALSTR